jgi:fic family protein
LIVDGITAKGKPLYDHNMVKDHFEALRFIVEEAKKKREITPVFIQEISVHVMRTTGGIIYSSAGDYDSSKGDWRKSSVHVGDRYFVNYQKIEREVTRLCEILNQRIKQVQTPDSIYQRPFLFSQHPSVCRWKRKNFTLIDELYSLLSSTPSSHYI